MGISLKEKVIKLRKKGKTFFEIRKLLRKEIPKSTISYWCRDIKLSREKKRRIDKIILKNAHKNRKKALKVIKDKRQRYLKSIYDNNSNINKLFEHSEISRLSLALLYLTEGSKSVKGQLMFGNSNPNIIKLFLKLLRKCYDVKENMFRCTLQCRADQNINGLEEFWSKTTKIPLNLFYKARIDPRSIKSKTKKKDYKGVCRINHFSGHIRNELDIIANIIYKGL